MVTPLEKARKNPDSMKAKILSVARCVFGEYGFHGTTTRMIAREVGIDISTLYYHWGEKGDLYAAVILDITEDLRTQTAGRGKGDPRKTVIRSARYGHRHDDRLPL